MIEQSEGPMQPTDVIAIIREALTLPADYNLKPEVRVSDVPGWDSFAWVAIISMIEECSGVEFPVTEIDGIRCVGDLVSVASKLSSKAAIHD